MKIIAPFVLSVTLGVVPLPVVAVNVSIADHGVG